jgi:hypothetical protein
MDYYQKFKEFIYFIVEMINEYYKNKIDFIELAKKNNKLCGDKSDPNVKNNIHSMIVMVVAVIVLLLVIYLILTTIDKSFNYVKSNIYLNFKTESKLIDNPKYKQVDNLYYINDYFTIDRGLFVFVIAAVIILFLISKLEDLALNYDEFTYLKIFCYCIIVIAVVYYIINYIYIIDLGRQINFLNKYIYKNINTDFLNSEKICNYLNRKNEYDYKFKYGKCNDIKNNFSSQKLYNYIKKQMIDIENNIAPVNNIDAEKFKVLKDKNGILYKDKIIKAIFTFQLIKYFLDNDLVEEAIEFFSTFNLLIFSNTIFGKQINPFLYLRNENLMVFNNQFEYNFEIQSSFFNNKNIYNHIYKDFNNIQNNIQNIILEVYNICSYKILTIDIYYGIIFVIMLIILILYIYMYSKNKININL